MTNKPGEFQQPVNIGSREMDLLKQEKREAIDKLWREEEVNRQASKEKPKK